MCLCKRINKINSNGNIVFYVMPIKINIIYIQVLKLDIKLIYFILPKIYYSLHLDFYLHLL